MIKRKPRLVDWDMDDSDEEGSDGDTPVSAPSAGNVLASTSSAVNDPASTPSAEDAPASATTDVGNIVSDSDEDAPVPTLTAGEDNFFFF